MKTVIGDDVEKEAEVVRVANLDSRRSEHSLDRLLDGLLRVEADHVVLLLKIDG